MRTRLGMVVAQAVLAVFVLASGSAIAGPARDMTVGRLAVQMARAMNVRLPNSGIEEAAARSLSRIGVDLEGRLSQPLTEGDLVEIGNALGAEVMTSHPTGVVTPAKSMAFVSTMKGALAAARNRAEGSSAGVKGDDGINAACQGRAARDDRRGTPASPANPNATAPPCDGTGEEPLP